MVKKILLWHFLATLIAVGLCMLSRMIWPEVAGHDRFAWLTAAVFGGMSLIITLWSARLIDNANPYYFSWVTLFSVLIKLGVGVGMVALYTRSADHTDKLYVIPFIIAYLVYTTCEVGLLQRIIHSSKKPWTKS